MKALILRNDAKASVATARALIDKGFQILSVDTLAVAHALIRVDTIDLLVMDERIEGQLTHAIALSGERRNPYLSAILLTDRSGEETDDLYALIPTLYALMGEATAPALLGQLALSAVSNVEEVAARVARNAAVDAAEVAAGPDVAPLILSRTDIALEVDEIEESGPSYADVAIASPELAEIERETVPEEYHDAVGAEVAALFRKHPLPSFLQPDRVVAAKAG